MDGPSAIRELRALYRVSQAVHASLDLHAAVRQALAVLAEGLGMQRGVLALVNPDSGDLTIEVAHGLSPVEMRRGRYRAGEGVMGRVLASGEPMAVPRIGDEPLFLNRTGARRQLDPSQVAFLCVPVCWGSDTVGVLSADRLTPDRADLEEDLRLLTLVADVIAPAVGVQRLVRREKAVLARENHELRQQLRERFDTAGVVGASRAMRAVREQIELVARSGAPVLITGEEGTGRRTVATAIHLCSNHAEQPQLRVPCTGAPAEVVAEVLFGTGGVLEEARGGSVLLEEVALLPADSQQRLLGVLQEGCFRRGDDVVPVHARVLACTTLDLAQEVRAGRFLDGLHHRLNVVPIHLPPLRRRRGDIPLLVRHFLGLAAGQIGVRLPVWPQECVAPLLRWAWPDNVRELRLVVEGALASCSEGVVAVDDLPAELRGVAPGEGAPVSSHELERAVHAAAEPLFHAPPAEGVQRAVLTRVERVLLRRALEHSGGVRLAAARLLGINRNTLYHKLSLLEES